MSESAEIYASVSNTKKVMQHMPNMDKHSFVGHDVPEPASAAS